MGLEKSNKLKVLTAFFVFVVAGQAAAADCTDLTDQRCLDKQMQSVSRQLDLFLAQTFDAGDPSDPFCYLKHPHCTNRISVDR